MPKDKDVEQDTLQIRIPHPHIGSNMYEICFKICGRTNLMQFIVMQYTNAGQVIESLIRTASIAVRFTFFLCYRVFSN